MGKTDYGKHDIEHGVCTMDGTTHKFPIGIHAAASTWEEEPLFPTKATSKRNMT